MKIFESFDEREKAVENAAGNLAFKIFWCLMLIALIIFFYMAYNLRAEDVMAFLFYIIVIDMLAALCVKYYYCWTHDIDKKMLTVKFIRTLISSFIIVFIFAFLFQFLY